MAEYISNAPTGPKRLIARHLEVNGIRFALADYWIAYAVTFLTNERVVVASDSTIRVQEYQRLLELHRTEAVRISRHGCVGGRSIGGEVFLCSPDR